MGLGAQEAGEAVPPGRGNTAAFRRAGGGMLSLCAPKAWAWAGRWAGFELAESFLL